MNPFRSYTYYQNDRTNWEGKKNVRPREEGDKAAWPDTRSGVEASDIGRRCSSVFDLRSTERNTATGGDLMPLDPQDKQRLIDAYGDHMKAIKDFESHRPGGGLTETNEQRYFETEAKLERIADEIGVTPLDYPELEQSIEHEEGWSIG